eukprot:NODE_1169_length_1441_cov_169.066971_g1158_i0.p1 GENE.NODE_1169_length_1441_cov_169.066971_g1158_i0~~NODE_1169_length_1441_cov_169.066971_g1158_i0.p1  ORF type:complete len:389 (-),score=70.88 NODE_1169_length_1441_cov_169.066971_g1158_i0:209-1375(-)
MASPLFVHSPYSLPNAPGVPMLTTRVPETQIARNVAPVPVRPRDRTRPMRPTRVATNNPTRQGNTNLKKGKRRKEICLDYLKGVCKHNRYQCKYDHPEMPAHIRRERVCPVYYFTGHCKFGGKCPNVHPPKDQLHVQCAVTISGVKQENPPPSPSHTASSDDYAQFPLPSPTTSDPTSDSSSVGNKSDGADAQRRVNSLLNKLTARNFDSIVAQLRGTLHQGVQVEELIDIVCRRAPSDGLAQAKVLARVLAALLTGTNTAFSLAWKTLFASRIHKQVETGCSTSAKNLMTFLGALVSHNVFSSEHVEHLQHLLVTAIRQETPDLSDNAVLMMCTFLETSAPDLTGVIGATAVRRYVVDLQHATFNSRPCAQVRVMNLEAKLQTLLRQ